MRARSFVPFLLTLTTLALAACAGDAGEGDQTAQEAAPAAPAGDPAGQSAPPGQAAPAQPASGGAGADTIFQIDPENVAAAMRWNPETREVTYPLVSGLTSTAGGWNFNGYARGKMTIVVPLGAKVYMPYLNADAAPHSAGIVEGSADNVPAAPDEVVFPGAETQRFQTGLGPNQKSDLRFTASRAGRFLLVCGVPGHPTSGMWVWFEVSESARQPEVRTS